MASGIKVISFKTDGSYTIHKMKDMNAADDFATKFNDCTHYLNLDNRKYVTEWAGPSPDHPRWIDTNEKQAKTAMLLLLLES